MMKERRDGGKEGGRKKEERKEASIHILDLRFEVHIYISKQCSVFFYLNKNQSENVLKSLFECEKNKHSASILS